jgi:hypothetical protein
MSPNRFWKSLRKFGSLDGGGSVAEERIVIGGASLMIWTRRLVVGALGKSASTVGSSMKRMYWSPFFAGLCGTIYFLFPYQRMTVLRSFYWKY